MQQGAVGIRRVRTNTEKILHDVTYPSSCKHDEFLVGIAIIIGFTSELVSSRPISQLNRKFYETKESGL